MYFNKHKHKKFTIIILSFLIFSGFFKPLKVWADDREQLREELEKQEDDLKNEIKTTNPINEENGKAFLDQAINTVNENATESKGEFIGTGWIVNIEESIYDVAVKTRTLAFILYGIIWAGGIFYVATFGSKDVNGRRKVYLLIRNSTVLFFIYINLPLALLWLGADKSNITSLTAFNVLYTVLEFFQEHSLIITSLLAYSGITRLIISKNNLPLKKQGIHLIKYSFVSLIFFNVIPIALYFLVS